jgi:outer membrane lipoprotein carrier protein
MFETPAQKTQYPGALAFMMGNGIASSFDFSIRQLASGPAYAGTVLEGKPLVPNPSYETVTFFVGQAKLRARDPGVIERVLIVDAQGNKNRFDFTNASQPASIPASEFTFTPPPGTTITH